MWEDIWKRIQDKVMGLNDADWVVDWLVDLESDIDNQLREELEGEGKGARRGCNCPGCMAAREREKKRVEEKGRWVVGEGGKKRWEGPVGEKGDLRTRRMELNPKK